MLDGGKNEKRKYLNRRRNRENYRYDRKDGR